MELIGVVKEYDWGKKGRESKVAHFAQNNDPEFIVDEDKTYAELWIGTHPSGPAVIKESKQSFKEFIERNPISVGIPIVDRFGNNLPFLLKVLSINKPLSIQAHPDKKLAEKLHKENPDIYKDDNHKPEMIVALTGFEALCGFRPFDEIKKFIAEIPELKKLLGSSGEQFLNSHDNNIDILKKAFRKLFISDLTVIETTTDNILQFLKSATPEKRDELLADVFEKLHSAFPSDVGLLNLYFLNYLKLTPGEALFMSPNEPHGYISGDGFQIMGSSDNVVRAAFTNEHIDIETLLSMLTYKCEEAWKKKVTPQIRDECTIDYNVEIPEFKLSKIEVKKSKRCYPLITRKSGSIVIVIEGRGQIDELYPIFPGTTYYYNADEIILISRVDEDLVLFHAYCDLI